MKITVKCFPATRKLRKRNKAPTYHFIKSSAEATAATVVYPDETKLWDMIYQREGERRRRGGGEEGGGTNGQINCSNGFTTQRFNWMTAVMCVSGDVPVATERLRQPSAFVTQNYKRGGAIIKRPRKAGNQQRWKAWVMPLPPMCSLC